MIEHVIVEGIDRLGKDTLIRGILDRFGFFQVLHYQKPLLLKKYVMEASIHTVLAKETALRRYQIDSFMAMFEMMRNPSGPSFICNRAHLGEMVYAQRYRGYEGEYVFDIEDYHIDVLPNILLVVLYTSNFSFISDDGQSLDVAQREEEQKDFLKAANRSKIPNKLLIDVHDGKGSFLPSEDILDAVCNAISQSVTIGSED